MVDIGIIHLLVSMQGKDDQKYLTLYGHECFTLVLVAFEVPVIGVSKNTGRRMIPTAGIYRAALKL